MYSEIDGENKVFHPGAPSEGETIQVYLNGMRLRPETDYAVSVDGWDVTMVEAPLPGDSLEFEYLKQNVGEDEEDHFEPGETLSGLIDGSNAKFEIEEGRLFSPFTTRLFQNGLRLELGHDYLELGLRKVELSAAPAPADDLLIDYIKFEENWPMVFQDPESSGTTGTSLTELGSAALKWVSTPSQLIDELYHAPMWPLIHQDGVLYAVRVTDESGHCRLEVLDPYNGGALLWSYDLPGTWRDLYSNRFTKTLTYGDGKVFIGGMWEDSDDYVIAIDVETHLEVWTKPMVYGAQKYDEESGYLYVLTSDLRHYWALDPTNGITQMISETVPDLNNFPYQCCIAHGRLYCGARWEDPHKNAKLAAFDIGNDLALDWLVDTGTEHFPAGQFADEGYVYFAYHDRDSPFKAYITKVSPTGAVQWTGEGPAYIGSWWGELLVSGQTKDHVFILPYLEEATAKVFRKSDGDVSEFAWGYVEKTPVMQRWGSCNEDYIFVGGRIPEIVFDVACLKYDGTQQWLYRWPTYGEGDREMVWGPIITMQQYVLYQCRDGRIFCLETS